MLAEIPMAGEGTQSSRSGERPLGVTLIAILQFLQSIVLLASGAAGLLVGSIFPLLAAIGIVVIVIGLIGFYIGLGLLNLRSWAWTWAVLLNILGLIVSLGSSGWVSVLLSIVIVIYLLQPDIKARFR